MGVLEALADTLTGLQIIVRNQTIHFPYLSSKTYVVGAQKNRLNETVFLSTHNISFNWWLRKY